jgi:cobyrinic acid a,c-diamide synthase
LNTPKIVVAGATSGVGKTAITTAIMYALTKNGFHVQPFKIGPDFIDPKEQTLQLSRVSWVYSMGFQEKTIMQVQHR